MQTRRHEGEWERKSRGRKWGRYESDWEGNANMKRQKEEEGERKVEEASRKEGK